MNQLGHLDHPDRSPARHATVSLFALLFAFALTGLCEELPGPILPTLAAALALDDPHSGLLFTALFTATAFGALLVRGNFVYTLAAGLAITGVGAGGLIYATQKSVLPLFFLFGLGLGMAMTSISMFASRHFRKRLAATLSLLNFAWSGGAAIAPLLVARQLAHRQPRSIFAIVAVAAVIAAVLMLLLLRDGGAHNSAIDTPGTEQHPATNFKVPGTNVPWAMIAFFAIIAALETGVETTIGGWLSTYAQRIGFATTVQAAATSSFFWTAFLIGRGIVSVLLLRVGERLIFVASLVMALSGITAILLATTSSTLAAGAILAGLALAAVFPLNLALFLTRVRNPTHAGWMLAFSGIGGSILPWMTGLISAHSGSLHTGLFVPAAAIALMLTLVLFAICNRDGYLKHFSNE